MKLSTNFTLEEAISSQTAARARIPNIPSDETIAVMCKTAMQMENVRKILRSLPIIVSSWYRSRQLNFVIGGVSNSAHITGEAVDFICPTYGSCDEVAKTLAAYQNTLNFDQLILEHTWIHIAFNSNPTVPNRKQVLTLLSNGYYAKGLTDREGKPL